MTTMNICINGEKIIVAAQCSISQALTAWSSRATHSSIAVHSQTTRQQYAIALNQTFVPRSQYDSTPLKADDNIELLTPMAGG